MHLTLPRSVLLAISLGLAACDEEPEPPDPQTPAQPTQPTGGALWEQVFRKWDCTAAGRPAFSFEVLRQSQFGSNHLWSDLANPQQARAAVWETSVYLRTPADQAFRNFEYKSQQTGVLSSLLEWSLTANGQTPYSCAPR